MAPISMAQHGELSFWVDRQSTRVILNGVKDLVARAAPHQTTRCFVPQHDTSGVTIYWARSCKFTVVQDDTVAGRHTVTLPDVD
jgi:hypothetical protein